MVAILDVSRGETQRMKALLLSANRVLAAVSARARWSFVDQALISGTSLMTAILLVRTLGLHEFGLFALVMIAVQFAANIHGAVIIDPMMSLFDKRGRVSEKSYLAAVMLHQLALMLALACVLVGIQFFPDVASQLPISPSLAFVVAGATQFQDLTRRFFYVTERPSFAFLSDVVAYGVRLILLAILAYEGALTQHLVWIVIAATAVAATGFLVPDVLRGRADWLEVVAVTRRHIASARWLLGSSIVGWFSELSFILVIVAAVLGPAPLGAVRAIQNLINVANLLLQALENFVPSAATKSLQDGGAHSLLSYVLRVSAIGAGAIAVITILLLLLADPLLMLMYGHTFDHQLAILELLGAYAAFGHVAAIVRAGLRALEAMRLAFLVQLVVSALLLATALPIAQQFGVVGALMAVLAARATLTAVWGVLLRNKVTAAPGAW